MTSLYSNAVREFINTRPWPKGFQWIVEEYSEPLPRLQFVTFRENINIYPSDVQVQLANQMNEMFLSLRNKGVPIFLEIRKGAHE